jgi:hypothetical protein
VFHLNIAKVDLVLHILCCICFNSYTRMLQLYISNVSSVSDVYCKYFYLDVAYVALSIHICGKGMFQMFHLF